MSKYCMTCHLPIIGLTEDGRCNRLACVNHRMAVRLRRELDEQGQYVLHWETFTALSQSKRFASEDDCFSYADVIREQVADLFVIFPDGSSVELRQ